MGRCHRCSRIRSDRASPKKGQLPFKLACDDVDEAAYENAPTPPYAPDKLVHPMATTVPGVYPPGVTIPKRAPPRRRKDKIATASAIVTPGSAPISKNATASSTDVKLSIFQGTASAVPGLGRLEDRYRLKIAYT